MAIRHGYLVIADLSGYTAYLTSTELEHANGVIAALLDVLVSRLDGPIQLWRLEGDAVLAYTTDPSYPSGDTLLTICEDLYNGFRERRLDIHANSTCECRACAKVPELDLKIIVHRGAFEEMQVGSMRDISGPAAILVHRMAKARAREVTGIASCALFSQDAFDTMHAPSGLVPYAETMDHFGDVRMQVYDLDAAWNRVQAARTRVVVGEQDAIWTYRFHLAVPRQVAWELLVAPRAKKQWMNLISATLYADDARPGPGARYHCVHEIGEFTSWIADWEPFRYHTNRYLNVMHPHLSHFETYELTPTPDGTTDVRYTMGSMFDPKHPDAGPYPAEDVELRDAYKAVLAPMWDELANTVVSDPARYA